MKNQSKIILGGGIVIIIIILTGIIFSVLLTEQVKSLEIKQVERINAVFINSAASHHLTNEDFNIEYNNDKIQTFTDFFNELQTEEMLRIKVWDKHGTIVYSDDITIIGKNYEDNVRFQKSIIGELTTEIKEPIEPENMSEMGYGQLMEIYIPIYLESTSPIGVIELYYNMDIMNKSIYQINLLIVTSVTIMALVIICAVIIFSIITIRSSKKTIEYEKFANIGNLSSRLAHDIRNPLAVIKATLDIIKTKNDNLSSNDLEKLNNLDNQVYRISHQVNNVLDYIRGKPLSLKNHSLKEILESSIRDLPEHKGIDALFPNLN